jgi:hypothetical protein
VLCPVGGMYRGPRRNRTAPQPRPLGAEPPSGSLRNRNLTPIGPLSGLTG